MSDTLQTASRDEINRLVGKQIQKVRRERGISQRKLGRLINVHKHTIWSYEAGIHAVPIDKLMQIAYFLRCTVGDLVPFNEVR